MFKTLTIAMIAGTAAAPAFAQFAHFDDETEGFLGTSYNTGGINFFEANNVNGFYPDGQPFTPDDLGTDFIIERAVVVWNDFPDFVSFPNMLTFGTAYVPGDNVSLGALATASMSAFGTFTQGSMDIVYYENGPWGGIEVTLDALSRGSVVGSTSFTVADGGGRDNPAAMHLSVDAPLFDTMRIYATLNGDYTTLRAVVDNVNLVPTPGVLSIAGLGLLAAARRRRA
jgi:hypothetical protein